MSWLADNKSALQLAAFLLVLLAFPLLIAGLRDQEWMAWAGMALVVLGFAIPPLLRLLVREDDDSDDSDDSDDDSEANDG